MVVIGSGIGGLCAAGVLASYGARVVVCEAHSVPGGAAHGFTARQPQAKGGGDFIFDTGPSFFSGLADPSTNPLKTVFDVLGVSLPCHQYNSFGLLLPEGNLLHTPDFGERVVSALSGQRGAREWKTLLSTMEPLAAAVEALPVAALRADVGTLLSAARFIPNFLTIPGGPFTASSLNRPFSDTLDGAGIRDTFIRRWLDLLCFCLSGLPTQGTVTAEMAMMFGEFYKPNAVMDYPVGGVRSIVETLVRGLEKHGGALRLRSRVAEILVRGGRVKGVRLAGGGERAGTVIRARQAVICGASIWDTLPLLSPGAVPERWSKERGATPAAKSFMHLHVGFDTRGLDMDALQPHYVCLQDWDRDIDAEENTALVSIPSVEDSSLAPPGFGVLHAYTPATEPWARWAGLKRTSPEYKELKERRAQFLWQQLERVVPDIRLRAAVTLVGTPLTHARFLNRHQGTYGPALVAGTASFPGPSSPLEGLVLCGDSCFPGIGVPAVAASGLLAAHATGLSTLGPQLEMLKRVIR